MPALPPDVAANGLDSVWVENRYVCYVPAGIETGAVWMTARWWLTGVPAGSMDALPTDVMPGATGPVPSGPTKC